MAEKDPFDKFREMARDLGKSLEDIVDPEKLRKLFDTDPIRLPAAATSVLDKILSGAGILHSRDPVALEKNITNWLLRLDEWFTRYNKEKIVIEPSRIETVDAKVWATHFEEAIEAYPCIGQDPPQMELWFHAALDAGMKASRAQVESLRRPVHEVLTPVLDYAHRLTGLYDQQVGFDVGYTMAAARIANFVENQMEVQPMAFPTAQTRIELDVRTKADGNPQSQTQVSVEREGDLVPELNGIYYVRVGESVDVRRAEVLALDRGMVVLSILLDPAVDVDSRHSGTHRERYLIEDVEFIADAQ